MEDRLLTMAETAEALRAPIDTLRYWRSQGIGPRGFRAGKRVLFRESEVLRWIDAQMNAPRSS